MTQVTLNNNIVDFDACVILMDDDIREDLHNEYADTLTAQEFLDAYIERHYAEHDEAFTV